MNSYAGKLLSVDLTTGNYHDEPLNERYAEKYLGGGGLAARYLYDALDANIDPLAPDNPLFFMSGPLDATTAPSAGRFVVCARSPLTGLYGESNGGNFFGPDLKFAGYDGIVIRGRAASPVYLLIRQGHVELRDARHLAGQTTYATGDAIRAELGDPKLTVAAIGPAGENLVKYAIILATNPRPGAKKGIAGRCGMGTVMGSKNLKAIAVRAGDHRIELNDPQRFQSAVRAALEILPGDMSTQALRAAGTGTGIDLAGLYGNLPTKYWTQGTFDAASVSGNTVAEKFLTKPVTCHACLVACGHRLALDGHHLDQNSPEYETLLSFGSLLLNQDLVKLVHISEACDALGVDSITAGSTLGFAMYLHALGILPVTDAPDLRWGDPDQTLQWVERIARRQGLGDALAEGSRALGRRYRVESLAVQVNGLELAMHDPRALSGMALVYTTSPIGASHNQSDYYWIEQFSRSIDDLGIVGLDRFAGEGKAANVARHQDWRSVGASLVMCIFPNTPVQNTVDMIAAATGFEVTRDNVLAYGERMWNLKRALNLKLGYPARANEKLPELITRPLADGGTEGHVAELEPMLREYYAHRDWDWATGKPNPEKLIALGMSEIAHDLWHKS
jgi:aldehyde:ferredoxin oxidoreductase